MSLRGLGSFVEGMQGGMASMQDIQSKRQAQKLRDYTLKDYETQDAAAADASQQGREDYVSQYGEEGAPAAYAPLELQDPYILQFGNFLSKKLKGGKKKTAIPVAGVPTVAEPASEDFSQEPPVGFADGGRAGGEWKDRTKASAKEVAKGTDRTQQAIKTASRAGRVATGAAAVGAGAGIMGALQGAGTPTEEYYRRLGWDPRKVGLSFWRDLGARGMGVMADVGDSVPGVGFVKRKMGLGDEAEPAAVEQQEGPTDAEPAPAPAPAPQTALPQRVASAPRRAAPAPQEPAPEEPPQAGDAIDVSSLDISEEEMPNLNEQDWREYRKQALRQAVIKGIPHNEAKAAADEAVAKIQMRGFGQYAAQASALLGAGNVNGAKRALKAAYQYFPDGNDVKFAVQNGKLLAVGVDEKTQKPFEGGTHVITPEYLAGAIQNFSTPQNFLSWTKDWRDEAQKDKEYNEIKKPLAQAQINSLNSNADARMVAADAAEARALAAGGGGGMKQSDIRGSVNIFLKQLELLGYDDPQKARQLASVMSQVKMAAPNIPEAQIIDRVMAADEAGTLPQLLQRLQRMQGGGAAPAAPAAPPRRAALPPTARRDMNGMSGGVSTPDNPNMTPERLAEYDKYAQ